MEVDGGIEVVGVRVVSVREMMTWMLYLICMVMCHDI